MKDAAPTSPCPIQVAMIIDDETFDQRMYKRIIARSGLVQETLSFSAGDHAIAYLKDNPHQRIDLILLDINMPRMNGFEFLEAAARDLAPDFAKICIVMLTTSLDPQDRNRALQHSLVRDFLNKPLKVADIARVAEMLKTQETTH